jgi:glycosyltransferase involved in cell wall biosynthesis
MPKISACVITYNEEKNIARCLRSLSFADEIIVVDSESTDRTVAVAQQFTPNVLIHAWMGFGPQKNYAFSLAKGDWIITIDADEEVTPELRDEILFFLKDPQECTVFRVALKNYIGNYWVKYGSCFHNFPDYQSRIFLREIGICHNNLVHEGMITQGKIKYLKNTLLHYGYNNIQDCRKSMTYYGRLNALELLRKKQNLFVLRLIIYPIHVFLTFINYYFIKAGFLMGWMGIKLAYEQTRYVAIKYGLALFWRFTKRNINELQPVILKQGRT